MLAFDFAATTAVDAAGGMLVLNARPTTLVADAVVSFIGVGDGEDGFLLFAVRCFLFVFGKQCHIIGAERSPKVLVDDWIHH